jgi:hypothetical protein
LESWYGGQITASASGRPANRRQHIKALRSKSKETDRMNTIQIQNFIGLLLFGFSSAVALGQAPVITSIGLNGHLEAVNLKPGSKAIVEWASSIQGP